MRSRYQALLEKIKENTLSRFKDGVYVPQCGMIFEDFDKIGPDQAAEKAKVVKESKAEAKAAREEKSMLSPIGEAFNVMEEIENKFIPSEEYNVLLITGDAGSGKSLLGEHLVRALWEKRNEASSGKEHPIPFYIELLQADTIDILWDYLMRSLRYLPDEINLLKEMGTPIVLVLDGLDEITEKQRIELLTNIKRAPWPNKFKIVITSRRMGRDTIETLHVAKKMEGEVLHYHVLPFTDDQIKRYLADYSFQQAEKPVRTALKSMVGTAQLESNETIFSLLWGYYSIWTKDRYEQELRSIPELGTIVTNPYILSQVVAILPSLCEEYVKEEKRAERAERIKLTRAGIYDRFTQHHFKRQLQKLPKHRDDIDYTDIKNRHKIITANTLCPMPDEIKILEPGKIYIKEKGEKLVYSVITPSGEPVWDQPLDLRAIPSPFSFDRLRLSEILAITSKNRHTLDDTDVLLRVCEIYARNLAYDLFSRQLNSVHFIKYKICGLSEYKDAPLPGKIYVGIHTDTNRLIYNVITPSGARLENQPLKGIDIPKPFSIDKLNHFDILKITDENGHTEAWSQKYFDPEDKASPYYPLVDVVRTACPLKPLGNNRFTFTHKSLLEFFAARYFFNSVLTNAWIMAGRDLNSACLLDEPLLVVDSISVEAKDEKAPAVAAKKAADVEFKTAVPAKIAAEPAETGIPRRAAIGSDDSTAGSIIDNLANMAKSETEFRNALLNIVNMSKHAAHVWRAAANAITILNRAGFNFGDINFRGIRIGGIEEDGRIWGADMSRSLCHHTDFGGADIRGVNWTNAWIADAIFNDSCMDGVNFGVLSSFRGDRVFYSAEQEKLVVFDYSSDSYRNKRDINFVIRCGVYGGAHFNEIYTSKKYEYHYKNNVDQWVYYTTAVIGVSPNLELFAWASAFTSVPGPYSTSSPTNDIQLCSITTGRTSFTLSGHGKEVQCLTFSPNGKQLASGSDDHSIILWDSETGEGYKLAKRHGGGVTHLAYRFDGLQLASSGKDTTICIWDITSRTCLQIISVESNVTSLSYRPKSNELASGNGRGEIHLWSLKAPDEKPIQTLRGHRSHVTDLSYSPDGLGLVSASADNHLKLWKIEEKYTEVFEEKNYPVRNLSYLKDKQLVFCDGLSVHIQQLSRHGFARSSMHVHAHQRPISSITYRFDGKEIATAAENETTIRLWSVETGECSKELKGHAEGITCLSYKPRSLQLASGSKDGTIRFWATESGECLQIIDLESSVICLDYRPDGDELAIGAGCNFFLQSLATGTVSRVFKNNYRKDISNFQPKHATAVRYKSDGKKLVTGRMGGFLGVNVTPKRCYSIEVSGFAIEDLENRDIKWWEPADDRIRADVTCISYRPDNKQLAVGYSNKKIGLYSNRFKQPGMQKQEIQTAVVDLDFSVDGELLVSAAGNEEKTIKIWTVESPESTYKKVCEISNPTNVYHVKWSPSPHEQKNCYSLVSGSSEGAVRLWEVKKTIKENKPAYSHKLLWQSHATLFSHGAAFSQVMGLKRTSSIPELLVQRGAKCATMSPFPSADAMRKRNHYNWHPTGRTLLPVAGRQLNIDVNNWLIQLARKKTVDDNKGSSASASEIKGISGSSKSDAECHAKLIIQGIEYDTVLKQYYVVIKEIHLFKKEGVTLWGDAVIEIRDITPEELAREAKELIQIPISARKTAVDELIINVTRDQRNGVKYNFLGSTLSSGYNCLSYCEAKLTEIDLRLIEKEKWYDFLCIVPTCHLTDPEKPSTCTIS